MSCKYYRLYLRVSHSTDTAYLVCCLRTRFSIINVRAMCLYFCRLYLYLQSALKDKFGPRTTTRVQRLWSAHTNWVWGLRILLNLGTYWGMYYLKFNPLLGQIHWASVCRLCRRCGSSLYASCVHTNRRHGQMDNVCFLSLFSRFYRTKWSVFVFTSDFC